MEIRKKRRPTIGPSSRTEKVLKKIKGRHILTLSYTMVRVIHCL